MKTESALLAAARHAIEFIRNGVEAGYVVLPDPDDPARDTLPMLEAAVLAAERAGVPDPEFYEKLARSHALLAGQMEACYGHGCDKGYWPDLKPMIDLAREVTASLKNPQPRPEAA